VGGEGIGTTDYTDGTDKRRREGFAFSLLSVFIRVIRVIRGSWVVSDCLLARILVKIHPDLAIFTLIAARAGRAP